MGRWRKYLFWGLSFLILAFGWNLHIMFGALQPWQYGVMTVSGLLLVAWSYFVYRPRLRSEIEWPTAPAPPQAPEEEKPPLPEGLDPAAAGRPDPGYPFPVNRLPRAMQDLAFFLLLLAVLTLVVMGIPLFLTALDNAPRWVDYLLWPLAPVAGGHGLARWEIKWRLKRLGYAPPEGF